MSWYDKQILKNAAMGDSSVESYLARIGVPEETISFVTTITNPQLRQRVVGYLQKFPQTPSDLLMEQIRPQVGGPQQETNTPQEIALANRFQNLEFQKWLLINLRKSRNEYLIKRRGDGLTGDGYSLPSRGSANFTLIEGFAQEIFDWYVRGVLPARQAFQAAKTPEEQADIINEYGITNANTNLAGLSLDQAIGFSEDWHGVISGSGEGLEYFGEKKEDIVYGPKWSKPEWTGWTIKQIKTSNNLKAEGNKMGHCVGGYCNDILKGRTRIFSLRDPSNTPYVTMEVYPNSWTFKQIYGDGPKTGNAEPSKNLKTMIGEWMRTIKGANIEGLDEFDYSDIISADYREIDTTLHDIIYKGVEGYGLEVTLTNWSYKEAYNNIYRRLDDRRGSYQGGVWMADRVAKVLANAAVDSDIEKLDSGMLNEKDVKREAFAKAMQEPKHYIMSKERFDKMTIENQKEYLKDYMPMAIEMVNEEIEQSKTHKWYGSEDLFNPKKVEQKIINKAYFAMAQAKEFDSSKIKGFEQLEDDDKRRFLTKALDDRFQISKIFHKAQENDEKFYDYYDDYYLYDSGSIPSQPEREDYKSVAEYKKALSNWEEESQKVRDEAIDDYRKNNLPYCLDESVIKNVNEILAKSKIKLPRWIGKYFNKNQPRDHYPQILWTLESVRKTKKETSKPKKKIIASWFSIYKNTSDSYY